MIEDKQVDVCLFLEGTYPYITGGVASWTHDLIRSQPQLTFHLVCLLPPVGTIRQRYTLPSNVIGVTDVRLQRLAKRKAVVDEGKLKVFCQTIEGPLLNMLVKPTLKGLKAIITALSALGPDVGVDDLLNSTEVWRMLLRMYNSTLGNSSFINFFWSWRGLLSGFYSVLLAPYPRARIYHALCTGYAGLFLARAHLEQQSQCVITEHGIYTSERMIEITAADWLEDFKAMSLTPEKPRYDMDLKDFWIDTFEGYSKLCYDACKWVITIYEGNQALQLEDGADPRKQMVIPNGVDYGKYAALQRSEHIHQPPCVALIGRVVAIKDVKCFIRAVAYLRERIPGLQAYVIGPTEEEKEYYEECKQLASDLSLSQTLTFTGKVNIMEWLPKIDVITLTSISEAQPLVLLEAGACGIPCVATDVGACSEIVEGRKDEAPRLGPGGIICPLSDAEAIADALERLLADKGFWRSCSHAMQERVKTYYDKAKMESAYRLLYMSLLN